MELTGRCYCGKVSVTASSAPLAVAYCHCTDCKRWTGAPLPAFAAVPVSDLRLSHQVAETSHAPGVARRVCPDCGSALTARFDYLPDQVYLPLGILDQVAELAPTLHCHADNAVAWLHLEDGVPRSPGSGRDTLNSARGT